MTAISVGIWDYNRVFLVDWCGGSERHLHEFALRLGPWYLTLDGMPFQVVIVALRGLVIATFLLRTRSLGSRWK